MVDRTYQMKTEGFYNDVSNFEKNGCFPSTEVWKQIEVLLERSHESDFGFTLGKKGEWNLIRGNDGQWEDRYRGHVITSIKAGGAADREGTLQIGDRLLEVNGTSVENMTPKVVIQLLQQSGNFVVILVQYKTNKLDFRSSRQLPIRIHLPKMQGKNLDITLSCAERSNGKKKYFVVDSIYEAGVTERVGLLCVGDEVLEINGEKLTSLQKTKELLEKSFEESWLEMVILSSHHKTRLKQINSDDDGDKTSNEIKFRRSPEHNYPDVTRTKSDMMTMSNHHWTNETTSCYPNFPATKLSTPFKAIKNVFNNCDPLRQTFCSTNRRRLSSHHDVFFKKGYAQPVKQDYLRTHPVDTTPKNVNKFGVRRFASNKQTPASDYNLTYSVLLTKPRDLNLGIRLRNEENDKKNFVDFIEEFSLADQTKAIHIGDEIVRVNGVELCELSQEEAQNLVANEFANNDELCLVIRKTTRRKNSKRNHKNFDGAVGSWNRLSLDDFSSHHPNTSQTFHIENSHKIINKEFKVRAVVHHSLNDLGGIPTSKMYASSGQAQSLTPQKYGSVKIAVSPNLNLYRENYQTAPIQQLCETSVEEIKTKETQEETQEGTIEVNRPIHNLSTKSDQETSHNGSKLEMLLSTLHHIDSDPPSPSSRLSNLFDFLDSEDDDMDLPRPIMLRVIHAESHDQVKNSMVAASLHETSDSNRPLTQVSNISKSKQKINCTKSTNSCVCSLTYLTCSTSATTTTKHTSGCPRLDPTSHHCNYMSRNSIPNKNDYDSTIQNKCNEQDGDSPLTETNYDQWSKLFESVQFSSVESFDEGIGETCPDSHVVGSSSLHPESLKERDGKKPLNENDSVRFVCDTPSSTDNPSEAPPPTEFITLRLLRSAPEDSFGFGLSDGVEEPGIFISGIMPRGPAQNKLQMYDKIFQVNKVNVENKSTGDFIEVIRESGCELELVICRHLDG